MHPLRPLATILLCAALAPHAAAQVPEDRFLLAVAAPTAPIGYAGTVQVPFTLTADCGRILQNASPAEGAAHATVSVDAPPWLTVPAAEVHFDPAGCVSATDAAGSGFATQAGTLAFTVSKDAPGVLAQLVNASAVFEAGTGGPSNVAPIPFTVAYHSEYTVVPSITFPATVTGGVLHFNVTVTQRSNARSMVMFEEVHETAGKLSGLASVVYDPSNPKTEAVPCGGNPSGETTQAKVFCVRYLSPTGAWTRANVTFTNFGHYLLLDQRAGDFQDAKPTVWAFVNGGGTTQGVQESPLNGWLLAIAVVGAAFLARRRLA